MDAARLDLYNTLKRAVGSGWQNYTFVRLLLKHEVTCGIHAFFCADLPKCPLVCSRCEELLKMPLQDENTPMLRLLLEHGAYPSEDAVRHQRQTSTLQSQRLGTVGQDRDVTSTDSHQIATETENVVAVHAME